MALKQITTPQYRAQTTENFSNSTCPHDKNHSHDVQLDSFSTINPLACNPKFGIFPLEFNFDHIFHFTYHHIIIC